jgi:E3 ubiquitin-protein ligase RNF14
MLDCGHVFCVACLQDFYNNAITEGHVATVRCLTPNCAKEREEAVSPAGRKRKKPRTFINPSELLQIPLDQAMVQRYVTLKYKVELESDKNTIYCPRQWCNGAARSKKHKKPQGLELAEASDDSASGDDDDDDDDQDHPEGEGKSKPYKPAEVLLAICEECTFAFCSRCFQSWHGEFFRCNPPRDKLSAEELASLEYMKMHTTPCPSCGTSAQKTHGCNHMTCFYCHTHFCYLCSAWLDPKYPYSHFNNPAGGCYMRLWEMEEGDGHDVGIDFAGAANGAARPAAFAAALAHELVPEIEEPEEDEALLDPHAAAPQPQEPHVGGGQVGIAREGPLVLRIAANQPAAPGRGGPRGRQPAAPAPQPAPQPAPRAGRRAAARAARNQQGAQAPGAGAGAAAQRGGQRPGAGAVAAGQQRGRGRGGIAGGPAHQQININNQVIQAERAQRRNLDHAEWLDDIGQDGELAPAHQAWVRQFVQLALNDEEDILFEEHSDDDI